MNSVFFEKSAQVLFVDPSEDFALKAQQALTGLGFSKFEYAATLNEAKRIFESRSVGWVVTHSFLAQKQNFLTLLDELYKKPPGSETYVSVFFEDTEFSAIPFAFSQGILSYHRATQDGSQLRSQFVKLLEVIREAEFQPEITAASFLREYLKKQSKKRSLLELDRALALQFPTHVGVLFHLSEAYLEMGKIKEAVGCLNQARFFDPSVTKRVAQLKSEITLRFPYERFDDLPLADFGLDVVVVVEPDEAVQNILRQALTRLQAKQVLFFATGDEAWNWLKNNKEPSLIVMEWRVPKVTGPMLLQRIRGLEMFSVPVIVSSSLIRESDANLLNEMSVNAIVVKPYNESKIIQCAMKVMQQEKAPTEIRLKEKKMLDALLLKNFSKARELRNNYLATPNLPDVGRIYIEAEFLYADGKFKLAREMLTEFAKRFKKETLATVNLLGKCCLRLGEHGAALQHFKRAQDISPQNLLRLCKIADVEMSIARFEDSIATIEKAKKIDAANPVVLEVQSRQAVLTNNMQLARELIGQGVSSQLLTSFLNNQAVAKIRDHRHDEGIEMYERALEVVDSNDIENLARINYNVGLANVRVNNLDHAERALQSSLLYDTPVSIKAMSLLKRVKKAKLTGELVELRETEETTPDFDLDYEVMGDAEDAPVSADDVFQREENTNVDFQLPICLVGIFNFYEEYEGLSLLLANKNSPTS